MSISSTTYVCDWPECNGILVCIDPHDFPDNNWEYRAHSYHLCSVHRFESTDKLIEAIREEEKMNG